MELSKEDSEVYMKIVKHGNMDDMFGFGYACGRADLAKEQLEALTPLPDNKGV